MGTHPYQSMLEALRPLLLPMELTQVTNAEAAAIAAMRLPDEPLGETIERAALLADLWVEGEDPADLRTAAKAIIAAGMPTTGGDSLASRYQRLLRKLEADLQSRERAAALISEAPLIYRLAKQHGMSATQIAHVLSQVLGGTFFPYDAVRGVMSALGIRISLDPESVSTEATQDELRSRQRFAAATLPEAAEIVGESAARLGFDGDIVTMLWGLCPPSLPTRANIPYLQALEFICYVAGSFDHPPQFLYEFAPRGQVANRIFDRYSDRLAPTGNPILNNFKAVEAVDWAWARSRPSMASNGLVRLLEGMARLPQAPRRDLASLLRQWLLHVTSLLDQRPRMVFDTKAISSRNVDRLLDWVISGNTQTAGTVEQRLIDGLAAILHPEEAGWRGRGFGDAVYVSNLSRRKVGDCEFQNTPTRTVAGYEPHGGRLTGHYRDGHLKSLRRVIDLRIDEWSRVADIHEWVVDVHFVAHEIDRTFSPSKEEMSSGPTVIISAATFRQFIDRVRSHVEPRQLNDAMVHFVFSALNEPQIGQWIRDSASINCSLELISESSEPD